MHSTDDHGDDVDGNGQLTAEPTEGPPGNDDVNGEDRNGQGIDNVTDRQVNDQQIDRGQGSSQDDGDDGQTVQGHRGNEDESQQNQLRQSWQRQDQR